MEIGIIIFFVVVTTVIGIVLTRGDKDKDVLAEIGLNGVKMQTVSKGQPSNIDEKQITKIIEMTIGQCKEKDDFSRDRFLEQMRETEKYLLQISNDVEQEILEKFYDSENETKLGIYTMMKVYNKQMFNYVLRDVIRKDLKRNHLVEKSENEFKDYIDVRLSSLQMALSSCLFNDFPILFEHANVRTFVYGIIERQRPIFAKIYSTARITAKRYERIKNDMN